MDSAENKSDKSMEEAMENLKIDSSRGTIKSNLSTTSSKDLISSDATSCISSGEIETNQDALTSAQGMYYYGYTDPGFNFNGSVGDWDDNNNGYLVGTKGFDIYPTVIQAENGSYLYYYNLPEYQSIYNSYSPFIVPPNINTITQDGQLLSHQHHQYYSEWAPLYSWDPPLIYMNGSANPTTTNNNYSTKGSKGFAKSKGSPSVVHQSIKPVNKAMTSTLINSKENKLKARTKLSTTREQNLQINPDKNKKYIIRKDLYNQPDFPTKYEQAMFFVIKSYSEDDIHKSIKYGVWSSTPNGNKRLDSAFKLAQEKICDKRGIICPIFLFFSVNASGQFCGVGEMEGPVDNGKSMEFWQQDKWTGHFPVKWHVIKDVPNPQFRHIILENNENKPVTNSRDTQEVKFAQGIEMLKIFKNYSSKTSILDDFEFYENRQKLLQEKRSKPSTPSVTTGTEKLGQVTEHSNDKEEISVEVAKGG